MEYEKGAIRLVSNIQMKCSTKKLDKQNMFEKNSNKMIDKKCSKNKICSKNIHAKCSTNNKGSTKIQTINTQVQLKAGPK